MEQIYNVIGFFGIVAGLIYMIVAATSKSPTFRNNPGLYLSGSIAFIGGILLVLLP
jgi:uncharacterized membrane protein YjjP (DUF1212 family)